MAAAVVLVALLAPAAGTTAVAAEPAAPVLEQLFVRNITTVNPDWGQGPQLSFTATDSDGIRTVSATWCHLEHPEACVVPTTGEVAPGATTLQQLIWAEVAPDAPLGGPYRLQYVRVVDHAGHFSTYLPDGSVETSPAGVPGPTRHNFDLDRDFVVLDHTAPQVTGFSWPEPDGHIAVPGDGPVRLNVQASDDWREPLIVEVVLRFDGPSTVDDRLTLTGTLSGDAQQPVSGTVAASNPFDDSGGPSGQWTVYTIMVSDGAGNSTFYRWDGVQVRQEHNRYDAFPHTLHFESAPLTVRNPRPHIPGALSPDDGTLRVHWEPAVERDGSPPHQYTVTARPWVDDVPDWQAGWGTPDPNATPAVTQTVPGTQTTVDVTGLNNGREYYLTVTSHLADGRQYTTGAVAPFQPVPTLQLSPQVRVVEGDSGNAHAVLTARLSTRSARAVSLRYNTVPGTATRADFSPASDVSASVPAGALSTTIRVPVRGDTADEADETFTLQAFEVVYARMGNTTGTIAVLDDDPAPGAPLGIGSVATPGGESGTASAVFTVRLAHALTRAVTVDYRTADRTAVAGLDYATTSGTLRFKPGAVARYVRVPVYARPDVSTDSSFIVRLGNPQGTTIDRRVGWGQIRR